MTLKITACCDKCEASESFTDSTLVNPWLDAHRCPTPPVELPTEPTLGWLDWYAGEESSGLGVQRTAFGTFERLDGGGAKRVDQSGYWPAGVIQAFMPAVAVPASALDELRAYFGKHPRLSSTVNRFLAAVDAANGDAS